MSEIKNLIDSVLSPEFPPHNPLLRNDWAGLAFNRNYHKNLAPDGVWQVLIGAHEKINQSKSVRVISVADLVANKPVDVLSADIAAFHEYWLKDMKFLADHYIFSSCGNWVVRLDQDVTLFAGELNVMGDIVRELGGLPAVMSLMVEDMDPGPEDSVGLMRYLISITDPLVNSGI